jgi:hypothetical protein
MNKMRRTYLLIATAFVEVSIGLLLLGFPSVPLTLLLGIDQAAPEVVVCARITGAALLALGVACWLARNDPGSSAQTGLLLGMLTYDLAAAGILAYAGWFLGLAGIALWPAVGLHFTLAVCCVACTPGSIR